LLPPPNRRTGAKTRKPAISTDGNNVSNYVAIIIFILNSDVPRPRFPNNSASDWEVKARPAEFYIFEKIGNIRPKSDEPDLMKACRVFVTLP
jgi:hypothetical protein